MVKKQRKMSKLVLQKETLRDLVTGSVYYNQKVTLENTEYTGKLITCGPVSGTCGSVCVCDA